jgi:hypothetical protein
MEENKIEEYSIIQNGETKEEPIILTILKHIYNAIGMILNFIFRIIGLVIKYGFKFIWHIMKSVG